jgi:hypothetical protein
LGVKDLNPLFKNRKLKGHPPEVVAQSIMELHASSLSSILLIQQNNIKRVEGL